jgi:hypothetical protein
MAARHPRPGGGPRRKGSVAGTVAGLAGLSFGWADSAHALVTAGDADRTAPTGPGRPDQFLTVVRVGIRRRFRQ